MTDANVTFVGAEEAMTDMRRWADDVGPAVMKAAADPFAVRVADLVSGRVPYLTGQLAGSVEVNENDEAVEIAMGGGLAYAGWIEFGGSRGRPFISEGRYLYPTALEAQDEFANVATEATEDSARRFSWSTPSG